jgi:hypothetical protein
MAAGVITVGGKKYAVGLYWEVSDSRSAAKAARQAAQQPGSKSDFYCIRPGNAKGRAPQFGLGEGQLGHAWNMPTAAATLANRQPGSWSGVFMVPEGVWFIEVRDDLIAPEGDVLFADEAEAMTRLQEVSARGGLERIYAPPSWAIPGAEASSLPSLLSGKGDARLQPVKIPRKLIMGVLAGIIALVVLGTAAMFIMSMREQQAEEEMLLEQQRQQEELRRQGEERARLEEEERQRRLQQQAFQMPSYQRVWEQAPHPIDWLKACRAAMEKIPISALGWDIAGVSCSGNQLHVSWTRTTGPADVPPGATVEPGLRGASRYVDLPEIPARGAQQLWPTDAINLYIMHNDWKADIANMPDEQLPNLPDGQQAPPPPWAKRSVRWNVPLAPWTLKGPLVDLPGFMLQNLVWSRDGNWQMEGVLYEQRK